MKLRYVFIFTFATLLLAACNFSLAADVTPPPGYVPPTPAPTLGPLFPANPPDVDNGAVIFVEKCAPCHGHTGMGDGEKGKELPVTVAPLALPETAINAIPAKWYATVTQGNIERFMPPFNSLNDQERWNVISYALTLHTTSKQMEEGKALFETKCADCADKFKDQKRMAELSESDIVNIIKKGEGDIPAFGKDFIDEEAHAVAAYIRTLTFATPPPAPTAAPATETPAAAEAGTPSAEGTPVEGAPQAGATIEATPIAGFGNVTGAIKNLTGTDLPSDLKVTLRGYEHGGDPNTNTGPQEILTLETIVNTDGTYTFENVELPDNRIFVSELTFEGLKYQSEFAVVKTGVTELVMPDVSVYNSTEDFSTLKVDSVQIFFDYASEGSVQIFSVYTFKNTGAKTIVIKMGDKQEVPFIAFPKDATGMGFEAMQDSAPFVPTDTGFALPPNETPYGLIAFATITKSKEIVISQPALLPIGEATLFLPEGVEAKGAILRDDGVQPLQATNFHVYTVNTSLKKGDNIEFTLSGEPKVSTAKNPDIKQNSNLLIGIGALGVALILAGAWLYWRDRKRAEESDDEEDGEDEDDDNYDDAESMMDAIIALDDLHRAGKISDEAYKQRRDALKAKLKK